jgi:hypothetical protein
MVELGPSMLTEASIIKESQKNQNPIGKTK